MIWHSSGKSMHTISYTCVHKINVLIPHLSEEAYLLEAVGVTLNILRSSNIILKILQMVSCTMHSLRYNQQKVYEIYLCILFRKSDNQLFNRINDITKSKVNPDKM